MPSKLRGKTVRRSNTVLIILLVAILNACSTEGECDDKASSRCNGKTGPKGETGETGKQGEAGQPGPEGPAGTEGRQGAEGPTGAGGTPGRDGNIGPQGPQGPAGVPGPAGEDGESYESELWIMQDIDRALPWSTSNHMLFPTEGYIHVPTSFLLYAIPSTGSPHQGWIDLVAGNHVYCFQREMSSYQYTLKYKKATGAVAGCDSNSEKDTTAFSLTPQLAADTIVRVIPRDPKLSGVIWDWELRITTRE